MEDDKSVILTYMGAAFALQSTSFIPRLRLAMIPLSAVSVTSDGVVRDVRFPSRKRFLALIDSLCNTISFAFRLCSS